MKRLGIGLAVLKARLKARSDTEHEQAIVRIVVVGIVLAYLTISYNPGDLASGHGEWLLVVGVAIDLLLALALFAAICLRPAVNVSRRYFGMLMDASATTFCVALAGKAGIPLFGVYLFITFGNGFRYGRVYLFACQALSLLGFVGVLFSASYWVGERGLGVGLLCSLVVLPLYVSTLLTRVEEARKRAEEASIAKTSFLANMSHEMRTPLNGIAGATDLLQATTLSVQQNELVRLLRHSVVVLRSLVDDVLDISKIEAGRLSVEVVDFDLHALLNGLVNLLRSHARAKGLALHAFVDPAIDYRVTGDPHHLRQVLLNLLSNAIKFTESGEIGVSVSLISETDEGWRMRFEVRDTGIGISPSSQQKIFERFVQADNSTTRKYGGSGLGTTIAKQLVELMGGSIGVKSKIGQGSTFWFDLPLLKTAMPVAPPPESAEIGSAVALVLAEGSTSQLIHSLVAATVGQVQIVSSVRAQRPQLRKMRDNGINVPAVVISGDTSVACEAFEGIASDQTDGVAPTAMIYLATDLVEASHRARLNSIEGVTCLPPDASPRLLRNAIHAITTREPAQANEGAEIIDLGLVLQQQRQRLRILVAEDNSTNQAIIRQLLERAGHTVLIAANGEEALDRYVDDQPELAILDFNMPERNGIEVCTAIRTMEPTGKRLPVIILSASVTVEARERAQRAGADEFVGKPLESAALLLVIDRLARQVSRSGPRSQSTQVGVAPLIDRSRLAEIERIATDSTFCSQLLGGFRDDVESLLNRLDHAIASEKTALIVDITHAIKGAALGVGARQLAERCPKIDAAAAGAQTGQLRTLATEMRRCFEATNLEFTTYTTKQSRAMS